MRASDLKEPFDIHAALERVSALQGRIPPAALWRLAEEGHSSLFEVLIGCLLSVRTLDEVMYPAAQALFALAPTPEKMMGLTPEEILLPITACTFAPAKAGQIATIAHQAIEKFNGTLPCDRETLLSFHGVGPKCAHLSLAIACHLPLISVDIHVHRVVNRWGYVQAGTPEATLEQLEAKLPMPDRRDLNRLLMPFGKTICTGVRPHCSTCPVLSLCPQRGVSDPR